MAGTSPRFRFAGQRVRGDQTTADIAMNDGDYLDVRELADTRRKKRTKRATNKEL